MYLPQRYQNVPHHQPDAVQLETQQQDASFSHEQFQKVPFVQTAEMGQQQDASFMPEKVPDAQFEAMRKKDLV